MLCCFLSNGKWHYITLCREEVNCFLTSIGDLIKSEVILLLGVAAFCLNILLYLAFHDLSFLGLFAILLLLSIEVLEHRVK
jgi:hypothetical protein